MIVGATTTTATETANVRHSVRVINDSDIHAWVREKRHRKRMKDAHKKGDEQPDPELPPLMYRLHTSRRIHQGERIVLPYHLIVQKFQKEPYFV